MNYDNRTLWGIHAGRTGDANTLFLKKKCIAISFSPSPDLQQWNANRENFKEEVAKLFPEKKKGAIPDIAGQLYRFIHEVKNGDLVVYPSKTNRQIHIGEIQGEYQFSNRDNPTYPHRRNVKWLKNFPRTKFTQGALYEIGSAMSFFQVRNYASEFIAALSGIDISPGPGDGGAAAAAGRDRERRRRGGLLRSRCRTGCILS